MGLLWGLPVQRLGRRVCTDDAPGAVSHEGGAALLYTHHSTACALPVELWVISMMDDPSERTAECEGRALLPRRTGVRLLHSLHWSASCCNVVAGRDRLILAHRIDNPGLPA
jgi:hypothetical protein